MARSEIEGGSVPRISLHFIRATLAGGAPFSFKKWHSVFPQNRYFLEAGAASGIGLVQQPVQIAAALRLRDLTLFVRSPSPNFDSGIRGLFPFDWPDVSETGRRWP